MRGTTSPRLLLELICARMLLPGADGLAAALLQRLERMERRLGAGLGGSGRRYPGSAGASADPLRSAARGGELRLPRPLRRLLRHRLPAPPAASAAAASAASAPAPTTPPPPAPAPAAPAGALDAAALRRVWEEIVATVGRRSKRTAAVVREATVHDVEGNTIVLHFQHAVHATMLAAAPKPLLEAVHDVLGGQWQVRCESGNGRSGGDRAKAPRQQATAPAAPPATTGGTGSAAAPTAAAPESDWPEPTRPGGASAGATPDPAPTPTVASTDRRPDPATGESAPAGRPGRAGERHRPRPPLRSPRLPEPPRRRCPAGCSVTNRRSSCSSND